VRRLGGALTNCGVDTLRTAGDQDVQAGNNRGGKETYGAAGEGPDAHQVLEVDAASRARPATAQGLRSSADVSKPAITKPPDQERSGLIRMGKADLTRVLGVPVALTPARAAAPGGIPTFDHRTGPGCGFLCGALSHERSLDDPSALCERMTRVSAERAIGVG